MINSLKKAIYVLIPLLVYYVAHDVIRIILMFILQAIADKSAAVYSYVITYDSLISGIISAIDMICGALAVVFVIKRDISELALGDYFNANGLSFYRKDRLHPAWIGWLIIATLGITASLALNSLFGITGIMDISARYNETTASQHSLPVVVGIILYGIISPAVEEFIFRLVIYGRMKRTFPYVISIVVSSVFFGLYHGNLVQGMYGTIMGILMCLACEYVHSIYGAFLVHSLANLTIYILGATGKFSNIVNLTTCVILCAIALIMFGLILLLPVLSEKKLGTVKGIVPVGCFFVDYDEEE